MLKNAQPQELESQIGEEDGLKEQLLRMCRQNKLAAFSAVLILVVILMAIFAPVLAPMVRLSRTDQPLAGPQRCPLVWHG